MDTYFNSKLVRTNVFLLLVWWTFNVVKCQDVNIQNLLHLSRYADTIDRRQLLHHQIPFRPTSPSDYSLNNRPISSPYRPPLSNPKHYYKALKPLELRRNDSQSHFRLPKRDHSPHVNPWLTLYRPSIAPIYPHRTKKPVEPSWKPAQMVLDEVPRLPSSSSHYESKQQLPQKDHYPQKDIYSQNPQKEHHYKHLYGSPEGIKNLRGNYGPPDLREVKTKLGLTQDLEDVRLANEHFLRMRSSGRCKVPAPEVVCVKDLYPNSSKEYLPRCTLLHRCGDRSSCCDSESLKCMPRAIQEVALNFYVVHIGLPTSHVGLGNSVEKLLFTNHTDCECVPNPITAITVAPTTKTTITTTTTEAPSKQPQEVTPSVMDENLPLHDNHDEFRLNVIDREEDDDEDLERIQLKSKCRECPLPFNLRRYPDGRCGCDCFDKHKPCLRIKRGRETLAKHEQRCVETNLCNIPECEHGAFDMITGRCPKKLETKSSSNHPRSLHNPYHQRIYFERD